MDANVGVFNDKDERIEAHRIRGFKELISLMLELDESVQTGYRIELAVK